MKTLAISSAIVLSSICLFLLGWRLFGGSHRKEALIDFTSNLEPQEPPKVQIWDTLYVDVAEKENTTNIGWIFTIPRRFYDPVYRQLLINRKWKGSAAKETSKGVKPARDLDGMREKRASSIVTYFCIFVLVLSLIRAALDMNSNLKKSREETVNQTINLDSRRCSLNDFKLAQAQLQKKEQSQRRAYLLRRAMTIVENQPSQQPPTQSMNNLDSKEVSVKAVTRERLERQHSISENPIIASDSPTKFRSRFSSVSPTPVHLRRVSFPALRRGSSMEVVQADMDDLISQHSPEVKRRMRLLRH